jgi:hypothetical protein
MLDTIKVVAEESSSKCCLKPKWSGYDAAMGNNAANNPTVLTQNAAPSKETKDWLKNPTAKYGKTTNRLYE